MSAAPQRRWLRYSLHAPFLWAFAVYAAELPMPSFVKMRSSCRFCVEGENIQEQLEDDFSL